MTNRIELRLSGSGGQGMILAGIILAEAAGVYDGKYVAQSQSYGPEARGGASRSDVVISTEEIDYPKAEKPDLLLALTQESYDKYLKVLKKGGILITDSDRVQIKENEIKDIKFFTFPLSKVAREQVGRELVTNIVSLAVIAAVSNYVSKDSLEKAVMNNIPAGTETINKKALEAGYNIVGSK
jgi:2-oxoglutarate ferredoxin oxidoreductase subunit gamma